MRNPPTVKALSRAVGCSHPGAAKSLSFWLGLLSLLLGLSIAAPAAAENAGTTESTSSPSARSAQNESPAATPPRGTDSRLFGYILLGTSGLMGFGLFGVLVALRRRRRRRLFDFDKVHFDDENFRDRVNAEHILGPPRSIIRQVPTPPDTPPKLDDALSASQNTGRADRADIASAFDQFARAAAVLHSRARKGSARRKFFGPGAQRRLEDELERLVCSGCQRRYRLGVRFCYQDGKPLMRDSSTMARSAPSFSACKACGWEGGADAAAAHQCQSGPDIIELNPSALAGGPPILPMMTCPACAQIFAPTQTRCPDDAHELSPLTDTSSPEFPFRGFGPRRKICGECGALYGPAARFCTLDGADLLLLN